MEILFQLKWEELITNQKVREEVEKAQNIPAAPPPPTISEPRLKDNGCGVEDACVVVALCAQRSACVPTATHGPTVRWPLLFLPSDYLVCYSALFGRLQAA